jgi:hypothetical protein
MKHICECGNEHEIDDGSTAEDDGQQELSTAQETI